MTFASAGKEQMLKILYGDEADTIEKFKIGTGTDTPTADWTDLSAPITYGGGELQDFTSHTYDEDTTTMSAQCDVSTTDYTGNISEFGIFTAGGTLIFAESFSTYYKDGSTNFRVVAKFRML